MTGIYLTARKLAEYGYYVYPVSLTRGGDGKKIVEIQGTWKNSTLEPAESQFEYATGIAIDCEKSGIVVVDVDVHDDKDGNVQLAKAEISIPPTPLVVQTWSGGKHYFYRQPEEAVGSSGNSPVLYVDIRGVGGMIFGPGTTVMNTNKTEIVGRYVTVGTPTRTTELPVLPPEFAATLVKAKVREKVSASTEARQRVEISRYQESLLSAYYVEDLHAIEMAGSSERHAALVSNVPKIIDRGRQLGMTDDEIENDIENAYLDSGGAEWDEKQKILSWASDRVAEDGYDLPTDYVDPDDLRTEALIKEAMTKLYVQTEAKKRIKVKGETPDIGRELDFDEPEGSLYGAAWVKDILPKGETVILFGQRYHGKSLLAMDLGLAVATGRSWHGRTVEAGRVLYLAGEGSVGLPSRRRAWTSHHNLRSADNFIIRDRVPLLAQGSSVAAFQKLIVDEQIDLVIVDTIRRASRGIEIAEPTGAQDIVETLDDLRRVRYGCTVLALHHPTKTNPTEPAGGGTLQDAVSVIHHLTKDDGDIFTLTTTKNKDGDDGERGIFGKKQVDQSVVMTPVTNYAGSNHGF